MKQRGCRRILENEELELAPSATAIVQKLERCIYPLFLPSTALFCISSSFLFIGRILARFVDVPRLRFFNKPLTSCLNLCSFSWAGLCRCDMLVLFN